LGRSRPVFYSYDSSRDKRAIVDREPIGHRAMPTSFRWVEAEGRAMIVIARTSTTIKWAKESPPSHQREPDRAADPKPMRPVDIGR
jgi:hypothetical protein